MFARLFGIFIFISLLSLAILLGSTSFGAFIDIPSAMIVYGLSLGLLLSAGQFKNTLHAIASYLSQDNISDTEVETYKNCLKSSALIVLFSGIVGLFLGLIQILNDYSDPTSLGHGLAVAILTLFYSTLSILFPIAPALLYFRNQHIEIERTEKSKTFKLFLIPLYGSPLFILLFIFLLEFLTATIFPKHYNSEPSHHEQEIIETSVTGTKGDIKLELGVRLISEIIFVSETDGGNITNTEKRPLDLTTEAKSKILEIVGEFPLEKLDSVKGKTELKKQILVELRQIYRSDPRFASHNLSDCYFSHFRLIATKPFSGDNYIPTAE